ncbi:MAG: helix-turn-helix transcriptional regulator [Candidatus Dormibacteraceae bacterium]
MPSNRFPLNQKLREARARRGWTQEEVVEALYKAAEAEGYPELKIDSNMISRWECGKQQPQAHHAFLLAKIYGKSVEQMGFVSRSRARSEVGALHSSKHSAKVEDMKRRNLMLGMGSIAALPNISSLDPGHWDRLSAVLAKSSAVDKNLVTALEAQTVALHDLDLKIPSNHLFPYITDHLARLTDILNGVMASPLRRRLIVTTGEAAAFSGWMAWDRGDVNTFQRLYRVAITAFQEANDSSRLACCLAGLSYMPSSRGHARQAEQLLSQASEHVNSTSHPAIAAWLEARRAEELARLGEPAGLSLIESSLTRFAVSDPTVEHSWTNFFTPARMDNFAINVYLQLGRHNDAQPLVRRALNVPTSAKFRPVLLADIATVSLETGNFEQGTEIAAQALDAAHKMQ